jgi:hypothetical protein
LAEKIIKKMISKELLHLALVEASSESLNIETILKYQVLCLPENFGKGDDLIDAQNSIDISKILKLNNIKCANSFDLELNANTLERRSHDIWLGQILIIDSMVLPTIISLLANYITNKFRIGLKEEPNVPQPQVNVEIKFLKNGRLDYIKFKGDGETLIEMLKTIKPKNGEE